MIFESFNNTVSHKMDIKSIIFAFLFSVSGIVCATDAHYTPERGSKERQAICDGARPYVIKKYTFPERLPQPILFKIERINVVRNYCSFTATPVFKDGSPVSTDYIEDIVFELCLKKTGNTWKVIWDLSGNDVPADDQFKQIWNDFPKDFPFTLLSEFWRNSFNRIK